MKNQVLILFILCFCCSYGQYIETGGGAEALVYGKYKINETSFVNSEGFKSELRPVDEFSKIGGGGLKYFGIVGYKRFMFVFDFTFLVTLESYSIPYNQEMFGYDPNINGYGLIEQKQKNELSNEYTCFGGEFGFKLLKQPSSPYVFISQMFMLNEYKAGTVSKLTEEELWIVSKNVDVRFGFGVGYKAQKFRLYTRYTPAFRLKKYTRAVSFSKIDVGLVFSTGPIAFGKKKTFVPKDGQL